MSKHRYVHVSFWQDSFVLDLTPEEKYFYLYLMTNSKTSQIGIYELPKRVVELETGYNRETVDKLLQRFIEYGKIKYHDATKEIMIVNWVKHNWNSSTNVLKHVALILKEVKNQRFIEDYLEQAAMSGVPDKTIQLISPLQAPNKPLVDGMEERKRTTKEKEKIKEKEPQPKKEEKTSEENRVGVVFDKFAELGFGTINPFKAEQLEEWLKTFEPEVIIKAMEIASNNNKATMGYLNGILNNWKDRELTTIKKVEAEEKKRQAEQMQPKSYQQKRRETPGEVAPGWMGKEKAASSTSGPVKTAAEDPELQKMINDFRNG